MGMTPFGSLLAGSLSEMIGAPNTVLIGGISCLLGSWRFAAMLPQIRRMVRPIYLEKGVLKGVTTDIRKADEIDKSSSQ